MNKNKDKIKRLLLRASNELRQRDKHVEVVLLFDVDETLVTAKNSLTPYTYNEALMRVWRKTLNCLTSVRTASFLFTSQSLCTPAFVYRPEDEPRSEPSRMKLRKHLRDKFRILVPGVITTYDGVYDLGHTKKIGAYYRDNIEPFEKKIQVGEVIQFDDPDLPREEGAGDQVAGSETGVSGEAFTRGEEPAEARGRCERDQDCHHRKRCVESDERIGVQRRRRKARSH